MEKAFEILERRYGSHKAASRALYVSYTRYNEWRWHPEKIPDRSRKYLALAARHIILEDTLKEVFGPELVSGESAELGTKRKEKIMHKIQSNLAAKYNVSAAFLEFIGIQDERQTIGKKIYMFNVMDPKHDKYKSTVAWIQ